MISTCARRIRRATCWCATGTGFAPLKSILDDMIRRRLNREVRFYWGGRSKADLYLAQTCEKWAEALSVVHVHSGAVRTRMRTGPDVVDWFMRRCWRIVTDLSDRHVYACGNPMMIEAARDDFTTRGGLPQRPLLRRRVRSERSGRGPSPLQALLEATG